MRAAEDAEYAECGPRTRRNTGRGGRGIRGMRAADKAEYGAAEDAEYAEYGPRNTRNTRKGPGTAGPLTFASGRVERAGAKPRLGDVSFPFVVLVASLLKSVLSALLRFLPHARAYSAALTPSSVPCQPSPETA